MKQFMTLSLKNRFSFTCPIFNANVEMRACVMIRDKSYKGEIIQARRGCHACVTAGKCPAAQIVQKIAFKRSDATDHCYSAEEKNGRLPAVALEAIRAVLVTPAMMSQFGLDQKTAMAIQTANDRIDAQLVGAPRETVAGRQVEYSASPVTRKAKKAPAATQTPLAAIQNATHAAAASGDLAAAIS